MLSQGSMPFPYAANKQKPTMIVAHIKDDPLAPTRLANGLFRCWCLRLDLFRLLRLLGLDLPFLSFFLFLLDPRVMSPIPIPKPGAPVRRTQSHIVIRNLRIRYMCENGRRTVDGP